MSVSKAVVKLAQSDDDIARCHDVIRELRPHIVDAAALVAQVRRQREQGYRLAYVEDEGRVVACAGFRVNEHLSWGKALYVDDLVTAEVERSKGYGELLLSWLTAQAKQEGCGELHLDSGTQRQAAHRFYFRERLTVTAFHFARKL